MSPRSTPAAAVYAKSSQDRRTRRRTRITLASVSVKNRNGIAFPAKYAFVTSNTAPPAIPIVSASFAATRIRMLSDFSSAFFDIPA
jgi:hypothetical protein